MLNVPEKGPTSPPCRPFPRRRLGVFQFFLPAPVAALLDERAGFLQFLLVAEQAGAMQVGISQSM